MHRHRWPPQGVLHVFEGERPGFVQQQPVQGHDDAGRAEAALRAAVLDDGLLRGGESGFQVAPLDRDHVPAVHLRQRHQAGGDRLVADGVARQVAHQDGAGAAVALLAAFLGAGQPLVVAQEVQQQQPRRSGRLHQPVIEDETRARLPLTNRRRSAQLLPERTHLALYYAVRTLPSCHLLPKWHVEMGRQSPFRGRVAVRDVELVYVFDDAHRLGINSESDKPFLHGRSVRSCLYVQLLGA